MTETTTYIILSTVSGILLAVLKLLYDSKCSHIKCFCIDIERDIKIEQEIEEEKISHV
jgi:hypothetical protein